LPYLRLGLAAMLFSQSRVLVHHLVTTFKSVGALTFTLGPSIPYAYQQFILPYPVPTTWQLGNFIPGAGICLVGAFPVCVPAPSLGMIFEVGASFPGHTPAG
jgi:hypothetical protein